MLSVMHLSGFGGAAPGPVASLGTSTPAGSSAVQATYDFTVTVPSGGRNRAIFALVTIYDDAGSGVTSAVALDPAGDNLALTEAAGGNTQGRHTPDIWAARLPANITGSKTLRVTATEACNSCAVTVLYCENVISLSPTFSGVATKSTGTSFNVANVTCQSGGVCIGCAIGDEQGTTFTWGSSLTERRDVNTGTGGQDHRHGVAWDFLASGRGASAETLGTSSSDQSSMVVASFR